MLRIGVIGYGYWGPNIVRNFSVIDGASVVAVCDKNPISLERVKKNHPDMSVTPDSREITSSPDIDIVTVITPVSTHYELAREALLNGKHVFVEKPFTASAAEAEELIEIAEKKNLKIMVDHTFLFTSAVKKIKQIIDEDVLGDLYYYDSTRVNLGLFQHDINVIWDLAPHDFSIMDYLIRHKPLAVAATGRAHINSKEDIAYIMVYFTNNIIAHINVNWLSPVKLRTTLIGGEKKMLVWNDVDADEKIKIYDRGVEITSSEGIYNLLVNYRSGDMWAPKVDQSEALRLETQYFVNCIQKNETPFNDGMAGLRIVKMLEACDESLKNNGKMVEI
ncbi:MAG: Gfo/Idh/MocA family oxidoreductase [Deltaproteobacteria bacterium]|nr:Gfo/Idh/MocA family oxidoreductase [Deltaproteobacteria bacterium]